MPAKPGISVNWGKGLTPNIVPVRWRMDHFRGQWGRVAVNRQYFLRVWYKDIYGWFATKEVNSDALSVLDFMKSRSVPFLQFWCVGIRLFCNLSQTFLNWCLMFLCRALAKEALTRPPSDPAIMFPEELGQDWTSQIPGELDFAAASRLCRKIYVLE